MDIQISNIRHQLEQIGCSAEVFCTVADVPSARWNRALRGVVTISGPEIVRLSGIVRALREIVEAAKPLPLSFRNVEEVKVLLEYHAAMVVWRTVPDVQDVGKSEDQQDQ
jgi:hypothetical protein